MWKFLFGKPEKEAAVVVDNYEDLLSKAMHQRQLQEQSIKLAIQNESSMRGYLKVSGWECGLYHTGAGGLYWQNSGAYPHIRITNEGNIWRVTYNASTCVATIFSKDINALSKLEAILATYKRLTSI